LVAPFSRRFRAAVWSRRFAAGFARRLDHAVSPPVSPRWLRRRFCAAAWLPRFRCQLCPAVWPRRFCRRFGHAGFAAGFARRFSRAGAHYLRRLGSSPLSFRPGGCGVGKLCGQQCPGVTIGTCLR
jgi:hypothetical protein